MAADIPLALFEKQVNKWLIEGAVQESLFCQTEISSGQSGEICLTIRGEKCVLWHPSFRGSGGQIAILSSRNDNGLKGIIVSLPNGKTEIFYHDKEDNLFWHFGEGKKSSVVIIPETLRIMKKAFHLFWNGHQWKNMFFAIDFYQDQPLPSFFMVRSRHKIAPEKVKQLSACQTLTFIFGKGIDPRHLPFISGQTTVFARYDSGTGYNFSLGRQRCCLTQADAARLGLKTENGQLTASSQLIVTIEKGHVIAVETDKAKIDFAISRNEAGEIIQHRRQEKRLLPEGVVFIDNLSVRTGSGSDRFVGVDSKRFRLPPEADHKKLLLGKIISACFFRGKLIYWRHQSFIAGDKKAIKILLRFLKSPAKESEARLLLDFADAVSRFKMSGAEYLYIVKNVLELRYLVGSPRIGLDDQTRWDNLPKFFASELLRRRIGSKNLMMFGKSWAEIRQLLKDTEKSKEENKQ